MRVAAYQMRVTADLKANFRKIKKSIKRASDEEADILALPECALSGYPPLHHNSISEIDTAEIAELNAEIAGLAKENSLWVMLGTILMSSEGLLNSAMVISDNGYIAGRYDKLHLMPDDKKFFAPGVGVPLFNIKGVTVGVLICYDARFPEPFRYLRENGAEVIINISNACGGDTWKIPVLEGTYRTRASENSCFVVAVNAAGPLQMATSRICNPLGLDLAVARMNTDQLIFADMDLRQAEHGYFYDRRMDQFMVMPLFED